MHHEYAVEPAAIGSSWERFLYLIEKFGFEKGRLISQFPKKWERQVIEAAEAADVPDVDHQRIVVKLEQKKRTALIRTGRDFDPALQTWVENALASHAKRHFRAIIALEERPESEVLSPVGLDEDHSLMAVPRSCDIPRTVENIAGACSLLLRTAREIDLVDPYFDLRSVGGDYCGPLYSMMRSMHMAGKQNVVIRIHYRHNNSRPDAKEMLRSAGNWVKGMIPTGYELRLYAWEEHEHGEDLHDRYLLCDRGGIMIGAGFAASKLQENATFTLLDDDHAQELRSKFADGSSVYLQVDKAVQIKANGRAELI